VEILLALATKPDQPALFGKRGTWLLESDNIREDHRILKSRNVRINSEPKENPWGTDFVFGDLYGKTPGVVQRPKV
jgi:hypothetical protein